MEYNKLVAVTGMPGLFELLTSKGDGAIVKSLEDSSTKFASSRVHNFSHLESIEVYTTGHNVNLAEVFQAMETAGGKLPDDKDAAAVKKYFEATYPDMDFDRVYVSDMKKMVKWFDILKKNKIEVKLPEPEPEEEPIAETAEEPATEKKKKAKEEVKEAVQEEKTKARAKQETADQKKAKPEKEAPVKKSAKKEEALKPAKEDTSKKSAAKKKADK